MISIQQSLSELERLHHYGESALESYISAINNLAYYAVELDEEITTPFRWNLEQLANSLAAASPADLSGSRSTLRSLLRDYHDKTASTLHKLHEDFATTARALQEILNSFSQSGGDNEKRLRETLGAMRKIPVMSDVTAMRGAILDTAKVFEATIDQIHQEHQLSVAQFLAEIRVLHKRIDVLECAADSDKLTKFANRWEVEKRIRFSAPGEFSLVLLKVRSFAAVEKQFGPEVCSELAGAFAKRLRNCLPPESFIGRWGEDEFAAMTPGLRADLPEIINKVTENLTGAYVCLKTGKAVRPRLHVRAGFLDSDPKEKPEKIFARMEEFFRAYSSEAAPSRVG
jgi:GGDEF domain-containing protein